MISVIIPVYNISEDYLISCIDSVLNQSYQDLEILLVNDGSNRECTNTLQRMKNLDSRIQLIHRTHGGVSAARNDGLLKSKGEYIAFVDADDWVNPNYLSEALSYIEMYGMDLVIGSLQIIHEDGSKTLQTLPQKEHIRIYSGEKIISLREFVLSCEPGKLKELKDFHHIGGVPCRLFRRKSIENCRFNTDMVFAEDACFNLDAISNMLSIGIVSNVWYNNRYNDESCTHRYQPNLPREFYYVLTELEDYTKNAKDRLKSAFCIRVIKEYTTLMRRYVFNPRTGLGNQARLHYMEELLEGYVTDMLKKCYIVKDYKLKYQCLAAMLRFQLTTVLFVTYQLKFRGTAVKQHKLIQSKARVTINT